MNRERHQKLEELFHLALEMDSSQMPSFLDEACGQDSEMRQALEDLLMQDATQTDPLSPLAEAATPPEKIGPYTIGKKLGEGGFAEVYLADQEGPLSRQVAIKILKSGLASPATLERFSSERQALAVMNHEGIARIHDAGSTEDGRPYFVMEYVPGIPITEYCEQEKLGTTACLELFAAVCDAVGHAHQKGVIHRDLKPGNILITDGVKEPKVKVIDFGIAKAIEDKIRPELMLTQQGQFIGTPEYMSPEQAGFGPGDIDTRTDIYSLGVILYEMLAGVPPFSRETLHRAGFAEVQRMVREVVPPRPSTRVSQLVTGARKSSREMKALRHELDWVVLKALEKDREQRYHSPADMAGEVRRFLNNEPLTARPPSRLYRARKFASRHRLALTAGLAMLLGLLSVAAGVTVALVETKRHEAMTLAALEEAEAVTVFLTDMISAAHPYAEGKDVTVRAVLDSTAASLDVDLKDRPLVASRVRRTLGTAYTELGEFTTAEPLLLKAYEQHQSLLGRYHEQTMTSLDELADLYLRLDRNSEALSLFQDLYQRHLHQNGPDHHLTISALHQWGIALMEMSRYEEAEPLLVESWQRGQTLYGPDSTQLLSLASNLANFYGETGQPINAEPLLKMVLERRTKVLGPEHPEVLESWNNLAMLYADQGMYEKAIPPLDRAHQLQCQLLGPGHFEALVTRHNLASMKGMIYDWSSALDLRKEGVRLVREHRDPEERIYQYHIHSLGQLNLDLGRWDEAEILLEEGYRLRREFRGTEHRDTYISVHSLGLKALLKGDLDRAEDLLVANLEAQTELLGANHSHTLFSMLALARVKMAEGHFAQADSLFSQVFSRAKESMGEGHRRTIEAGAYVGQVMLAQERWDSVVKQITPMVATADSVLISADPLAGVLRLELAAAQWKLGKKDSARELMSRAQSMMPDSLIQSTIWRGQFSHWNDIINGSED